MSDRIFYVKVFEKLKDGVEVFRHRELYKDCEAAKDRIEKLKKSKSNDQGITQFGVFGLLNM